MTRRVLRLLHRWLGLALLLPMLLQGISGTILAMTPIWTAWQVPSHVTPGASRPANEIIAAASATSPGLVVSRYHPANGPGPAIVELSAPGQRFASAQVTVDPVSLTVLGTRQPSAAYRWVHLLHEHLLMPEFGGRTLIGFFGLGLLVLGLSGIVLWWPSVGRWQAAVTVSRRASGARLQRELHGAAGFWFSIMLVVMSLSGMSMAFPQTARALFALPGGPPRGGSERGTANAAPLDVDAVLARLAQSVPGAIATDLRIPNQAGRPVMVRLERAGALEGTPPLMATIDPAGRRLITVQDPQAQGVAALTLGWLRALHQGDAFGTPWRLLVALSGVVLPLMAVTGGTLWWLKRRNRLRLSAQRQAAQRRAAQRRAVVSGALPR